MKLGFIAGIDALLDRCRIGGLEIGFDIVGFPLRQFLMGVSHGSLMDIASQSLPL